jgi:hypothetical protein
MLREIYLDTGQFNVKLNSGERFVAVSAVPMPCETGITVSTERPWVHE